MPWVSLHRSDAGHTYKRSSLQEACVPQQPTQCHAKGQDSAAVATAEPGLRDTLGVVVRRRNTPFSGELYTLADASAGPCLIDITIV
jgi:hypothetical protein